jgi:3-oxoacyl-[acyl-carrier protein] reductase
MSVKEKVVVITGGASGIGRFVTGTFAAAGAKVAIGDVAPTDRVESEVKALGGELLAVQTDVRIEDDVDELMRQTFDRFGRIDVVINNAAIVTHFPGGGKSAWPLIRDMDEEFFDNVVRTNLYGVYLGTKCALPYMESQGSGHIINIGQGTLKPSGRTDNFGSCVYLMTKIAVRSFTNHVAPEEFEHNVCIVSVSPGDGGGNYRGIWTEDIDEEFRPGMAPIEMVGDRYLLAAEAPMEYSGHQLVVRDGKLEIDPTDV